MRHNTKILGLINPVCQTTHTPIKITKSSARIIQKATLAPLQQWTLDKLLDCWLKVKMKYTHKTELTIYLNRKLNISNSRLSTHIRTSSTLWISSCKCSISSNWHTYRINRTSCLLKTWWWTTFVSNRDDQTWCKPQFTRVQKNSIHNMEFPTTAQLKSLATSHYNPFTRLSCITLVITMMTIGIPMSRTKI